MQGAAVAVPELREDVAPAELALGIRPEHIRFDDASTLRGSVYGTEYLGTTQIVAVETADGMIKARVPAELPVRTGETVGLALNGARLSLFDKASGRAVRTASMTGASPWLTSSCSGVTKSFGDIAAVDGLDLTIKDGEFVVLLGPTGAGKTTTLRLDRRAREAGYAARIHIGGRDATALEPAARDVAFVFQQYSLYPHLTRLREPRLPAALAGAQAGARPRSAAASRRWRSWCASTTSWRTARRGCPAARCSASPSAGRWCASRRSS